MNVLNFENLIKLRGNNIMAAHKISGESMRQDNLIPKMFSSVGNTLIELEVLGINYH